MAISVNIAVEDTLSESVLRRILHHQRRDMTVSARYPLKELPGGTYNPANRHGRRGLSGYGQLKTRLLAFNKAASVGKPFIVLTDLDIHVKCPGQLLSAWLPGTPSPNLVFRVAVKEVEAWLLADCANMAEFLEVSAATVPASVEALTDPKLELVKLARNSASEVIRRDLVPPPESTAEVGRYFERGLLTFVKNRWDVDAAAHNCRSLQKALDALARFKLV